MAIDALYKFSMLIFEVLIQYLKCLCCIHIDQPDEICHDPASECAFSAARFGVSGRLFSCKQIKNVFNPVEHLFNLLFVAGVLFGLHSVHEELQALHVVFALFEKFHLQMVEFGILSPIEKQINFMVLKRLAEVHQFNESILTYK